MFIIDSIFLNISYQISVVLIVFLVISMLSFMFLNGNSKWSYFFGLSVALILAGFTFDSEYPLSQEDIARIAESPFVNDSVMDKLEEVNNSKTFNQGIISYSDINHAKRLVYLASK